MPVRIAVDQHCFERHSIKHGDDGKPVELTYYSNFGEVFADIEDVQVGDAATVMYVESDGIADGVIDRIRPNDAEKPWMGGLVYIRTDLTTFRELP